jgi:hypothetical protein
MIAPSVRVVNTKVIEDPDETALVMSKLSDPRLVTVYVPKLVPKVGALDHVREYSFHDTVV